ncbi:MAG TPA: ATPase domain-containing protein [Nitrospiraceae bacterium]|nr:ATPase domain-containing protein [Nitrospiraceae bacterium]
MQRTPQNVTDRCSTGIEELDDVLSGGLPRHRIYVIQGDPGTGKTTLGMQFLLEGTRMNEKALYIALSETKEELEAIAKSHGWSLDRIEVLELSSVEEQLAAEAQNTLFHPSEVELHETTNVLLKEVERIKPARVVFDSLSEMRLLTQSPLRYRRQMLALKQFFAGRKCTVLLLDDRASEGFGLQVNTIAHGVINLEQIAQGYGGDRRQLRVMKLRGVAFRSGIHDFDIARGGLRVYPRLVAAEHQKEFLQEQVSSGIREIDDLLAGGLNRGTSTLIMGPAGAGKTTLVLQYAAAACDRGEPVASYIFDENRGLLLQRPGELGERIRTCEASGLLKVHQIDPAEMSPGEMAFNIRRAVERDRARMVIIDSLNGYLKAMPEASFLILQLHELLSYLGQQGIVTMLVLAQHGLMDMQSPADLTYLTDTVVLLRYFESNGEVKQAVSVIKKRTGPHERTIREFGINPRGIEVGQALAGFRGVLTGLPMFTGPKEGVMKVDDGNGGR